MFKVDEKGNVDPLLLPFIAVMILALGLGVFGVWAFTSYNSEKSNVDLVVAEAVTKAQQAKELELREELNEQLKSPNKTYISPSTLGSVKIVYPKTWSSYVQERTTGSVKLEAYFHPGFVPSTDSKLLYATRVSLLSTDYKRTLDTHQRSVENGSLTARAVEVSGTKGMRFDGEISRDVNGAVVLLPLREKTLKIWTESTDYLADFNKIISSLTYSP